jgi:Tol biopolymer transport system component
MGKTNKHSVMLIVLAAFSLAFATGVAPHPQQRQAELALKAAMDKEVVDGDLKGAIELYQQLAAGGDRPVAAQALVRMGQCYEKLGSTEARKAYQRVVTEYADQPDQLTLARARLAALAKPTEAVVPAPKFRRIEIPGKPSTMSGAMLSPDGTRFAFVAEGSIWTVPVSGHVGPDIAGEPVRLTKAMGAWDNGNCTMTWSVDGKWIAFHVGFEWTDDPVDTVYLVPASGGEPRRVDGIGPHPGGAQTARISVSQGAARIVFATREEGEPRLFTISGKGGRPSQLVPVSAFEPAFSPNGRLVAYISWEQRGADRVESIMVVPTDGGESVLVSALPGIGHQTESPTWSPDGKMIAFPVRTETGAALWIVPVSSDGRPEAEPTVFDLKPIVFSTLHGKLVAKFVNPLGGWSLKNEIALLLQTRQDAGIYTVPVSGGRATRIALQGREPRWSPDGKRVYFRGRTNIESVAATGGDERPVPIRGEPAMGVGFPMGSNEVSKDGKSIVFAGGQAASKGVAGAAGIFTVPSAGGEPRPIVVSPDGAGTNPCWSPDGKWIAYTNNRSIWIVSSEGGSPRRLTSDADHVGDGVEAAEVRWSPDGKTIAYFAADKTVRLIPSAGGSSQVLARIPAVNYVLGLSWSPDGSKLAYTSNDRAWVVPASGGEPRQIPIGFDGRITQIDWSPDNQTLAFAGYTGGEEEVWLMSDFVNLVKTARR